MSDEVVYVDRFQLREGRLDDFKRYATEVTAFVEENEPGVISFSYYVDEEGSRGTAIFELLGQPSDRAIEMGKSFNARVKTRLAGFSHP
jgi:hypothetical protein